MRLCARNSHAAGMRVLAAARDTAVRTDNVSWPVAPKTPSATGRRREPSGCSVRAN